MQKFALDYLRDQQILTPPCEWGWVLVIPLLGKTLEVEDSPGMVWRPTDQTTNAVNEGEQILWHLHVSISPTIIVKGEWNFLDVNLNAQFD